MVVCKAAMATTASHCILDAQWVLIDRRFVSSLCFGSGADYWPRVGRAMLMV